MELKIRKIAEIYIVDASGEMDLYHSYKLKKLVSKMIEKSIKKIVINLENIEYIDSSGIGALIYIFSTTKKQNIGCYISGVKGNVRKVIELTKLADFFAMSQDVNEAVQLLKED